MILDDPDYLGAWALLGGTSEEHTPTDSLTGGPNRSRHALANHGNRRRLVGVVRGLKASPLEDRQPMKNS